MARVAVPLPRALSVGPTANPAICSNPSPPTEGTVAGGQRGTGVGKVGAMIDPKWLRTDPDRIRRSQAARGASVELVDDLIDADESRRSTILTYETLRAEQKGLGKEVAKAKGDERAALLQRTGQLAADVKAA